MFREFIEITSRSKKVLFCSFLISLFFFLLSPVANAAFVDNGDGTVTDNETGLIWQKADNGIPRNWLEALDYAESLDLAGCNTWRLPNIKELRSIVDRSQNDPAIDPIFSAQSDKYWSSTIFRFFGKVFVIDFLSGRMRFADPLSEVHFIRAVTGGCELDKTAPEVISTSPLNGATGVADSAFMSATFNEGMDLTTITDTTFLVNAAVTAAPVLGTVSYSNGVATFTPSTSLSSATTYTATIKTGAKDVAGNNLLADHSWTFTTIDTTPPTGSIIINGNAPYANSTSVDLSLPASDDSGVVTLMQLSNDGGVSWSNWESYSPVKTWDITAGDEVKTIHVRFQDATGNVSGIYSDTITLDTAAPSVSISQVVSPTNSTSQTISGTTETGATVEVRVDTWANLCVVSVDGNSWECSVSGLAEGVNTVTAKAIDEAGNFSSATAIITVDTVGPTGSVAINNDAEWINSTSVVLGLSANDNTGAVSSMRFANAGTTWSSWEAYTSSKSWSLKPGDGGKTIYVQFMDDAGTESDVYTDTATLDTTPPSLSIDTASLYTKVNNKMIGGSREANSTVKVSVNSSSAMYASYPTTTTWEYDINGLVEGNNNIIAAASDLAGNESNESINIIYDTTAPTGTITISGGALSTRSSQVPITLTADDNSGMVTSMRFNNEGGSWSSWEDFSTSKAWSLSANNGLKTVSVEFMDKAGNVSGTYSSTITYDTSPPYVTIDPVAVNPTNKSNQTITGTRESDATILVSISGIGGWVGPIDYSGGSTVWQCDVGLAEGVNTITATSVDTAGNISDSTAISVTLDTLTQVSIAAVTSPTKANSQIISGTKEDDAEVTVNLNGTQVCQITSTGNTWSCNLNNLVAGANSITAAATEDLGNSLVNTSSAVTSIFLDIEPPTGAVSINNGASSTHSTVVNLNLSAADNNGLVSSVRMRNEGGIWSNWVSYSYVKSWNLTEGNGLKTVYVEFKDAVDNTSITYSDSVTLDTDDPFVTIDSVTSPTKVSTQQISGTMESGARVSVFAPAGLASQVSYTDATWQCTVKLVEGTNSITVTASDNAGNSVSAATSILLDSVTSVAINLVNSPTNEPVQTIYGTREAGATVTVTLNTSASAGTVTYPAATTWKCDISSLVTGGNIVTAIATDVSDNTDTAAATITYDNVPPSNESVIINGDADFANSISVNLRLSSTDNSGPVAFMKFSNGPSWSDWVSYATTKSWTLTPGDGQKTVSVQFMDAAGNSSAIVTDTITLDTHSPAVTINPVTSPTSSNSQTISGMRENDAEVVVRHNGAQVCQITSAGTIWSCELNNLVTGTNSITVIATDGANNRSSAATSIILDTVAVVNIDSVITPTNVAIQIITGTREPGASIDDVTVNGAYQSQITLTGGTTWQCVVSLTEGQNDIIVTSTDAYGNTGSAGTMITLDITNPFLTLDPVTSLTNVSVQTVSGTGETNAKVKIWVNNSLRYSSIIDALGHWQHDAVLTEGVNDITVTVYDAAGNSASDNTSIILDTTAGVTLNQVDSPTNDLTRTQTISGTRENSTVAISVDTPQATAGIVSYPTATTWSCMISDLAEGENSITITATENAFPTPNTNNIFATIVLDTIIPTVTIDTFVSPTNNPTQTITGTRSADGLISISAPGVYMQGISYPGSNSWRATLTLPEGNTTIIATAKDGAGNSSNDSTLITVDTIAEVTFNAIASPTDIGTHIIGGTREGNATISVSTLGASVSGPVAFPTQTTWQCPITLVETDNSITVTAVDSLGNIDNISREVVLDTIAPMVTIDPTPDLTNESTQTITGTRDSDGLISVTASGVSKGPVTYPSSSSWKCVINLPQGNTAIIATATDGAGNSSSASAQIDVDSVASLTLNPISTPTNKVSRILKGTREANADITVSGVAHGVIDLSNPTAWQCDITLSEGSNLVTVEAIDSLNNITARSTTVVLDTTPPAAIDSLVAIDTLLGGTIDLDWALYDATGEGVVSYAVYAAGSAFTDVYGMYPVRWLGPGTKDFRAVGLVDNQPWYFAVVAIDAAGNLNPLVNSVSATPTMQGVHGYITDSETGAPLQGVTVEFVFNPLITTNSVTYSSGGYPSTTTNHEGYYLMTGLPVGGYDLILSGSGYMDGYLSSIIVESGTVTSADTILDAEILEPSVPQNVGAVAGDGKITVTWDPVDDLDLAGYNLYRFNSPGDVNPIKVNTEPIIDNFYVDMGLINGSTYYYTVRSENQDGLTSADSEMASATPQAGPPEPASDLVASLNPNMAVTLSWNPSPTNGVSYYNIYWDSGTGTIDYSPSQVYAIVGASITTWTSSPLAPGVTYRFGLRAQKTGVEETNTSLVVSITIPDGSYNGPRAYVNAPSAGKKVSGNLITVEAELVQGVASEVKHVMFQYRSVTENDWFNIQAATVYSLNPDTTQPYFVHWDVEQLPEGDYELRARVTTFDDSFDPNPDIVVVTIDHTNPFLDESWNDWFDHRIKKRVWRNLFNKVKLYSNHQAGSFNVSLAPDSLESDTTVITEIPKAVEMANKVVGYPSIGSFLRLRLASGQEQFEPGKEAEISLPYPDVDNDGIVDGYGMSPSTLTIRWYNPNTGRWENNGISNVTVDTTAKKVTGYTSHFSDFGLMGTITDTDGDGLNDSEEIGVYGTDPVNPDTDSDGLNDGQEVITYGTNPLLLDTESDGMSDGWEVTYSLDPLVDDAGLDADGDGVTNLEEFLNGTNPNLGGAMGGGGPVNHVPVHNGWWMIFGMFAGLFIFRRKLFNV